MLTVGVYLDGKKLRRARVLANLTHRTLAAKSGVSTGTIWALESRERNPRFHPSTLHKLATALNVAPSELLGDD